MGHYVPVVQTWLGRGGIIQMLSLSVSLHDILDQCWRLITSELQLQCWCSQMHHALGQSCSTQFCSTAATISIHTNMLHSTFQFGTWPPDFTSVIQVGCVGKIMYLLLGYYLTMRYTQTWDVSDQSSEKWLPYVLHDTQQDFIPRLL